MFGVSVTKLSRQDSQQQQLLFKKSYIVSLSRYADKVQWFCTNCTVFCHERKMFADTRWQFYREADKYGLGKFVSHHSRLLQLNQAVLKQWQIADTCDSLAKDNFVDFKPLVREVK